MQDLLNPSPRFLKNDGSPDPARVWALWQRWPILAGAPITACSVQPLPALFPVPLGVSGNHFVSLVFLNFHAIQWHSMHIEDARGSAVVLQLVFDSLSMAVPEVQFRAMQDAFTAFIIQEAVARHQVTPELAARIATSIAWRKVVPQPP